MGRILALKDGSSEPVAALEDLLWIAEDRLGRNYRGLLEYFLAVEMEKVKEKALSSPDLLDELREELEKERKKKDMKEEGAGIVL